MALDAPERDVMSAPFRRYLRDWCVAQIANVGPQATVTVRAETMLALLAMAQYGKGLRTIQAKPFAERSKAGKHAANVRWDRARARKHATAQDSASTKSGAE